MLYTIDDKAFRIHYIRELIKRLIHSRVIPVTPDPPARSATIADPPRRVNRGSGDPGHKIGRTFLLQDPCRRASRGWHTPCKYNTGEPTMQEPCQASRPGWHANCKGDHCDLYHTIPLDKRKPRT
jgi:hypothetical protein